MTSRTIAPITKAKPRAWYRRRRASRKLHTRWSARSTERRYSLCAHRRRPSRLSRRSKTEGAKESGAHLTQPDGGSEPKGPRRRRDRRTGPSWQRGVQVVPSCRSRRSRPPIREDVQGFAIVSCEQTKTTCVRVSVSVVRRSHTRETHLTFAVPAKRNRNRGFCKGCDLPPA